MAVLAVCWLMAAVAAGDPMTVEDNGAGGAPWPIRNERVRMLDERVEIIEPGALDGSARREAGRRTWLVRAAYVFQNLGAEPLTLDVGFPMRRSAAMEGTGVAMMMGHYRESGRAVPVSSFVVRVDGETVEPVREDGCDPEGRFEYDFVYRFGLPMAGFARTRVEFEYEQAASQDESDGSTWYLDFILATGALWSGTIGHLEVVYRLARIGRHVAVQDQLWARPWSGCAGPEDEGEEEYESYDDSYDDSYEEGESNKAVGSLLDPGRGVLRFWEARARFEYQLWCAEGDTVLRLTAQDVEPSGDISLSYDDADGWSSVEEARELEEDTDGWTCADDAAQAGFEPLAATGLQAGETAGGAAEGPSGSAETSAGPALPVAPTTRRGAGCACSATRPAGDVTGLVLLTGVAALLVLRAPRPRGGRPTGRPWQAPGRRA